LQQLLEVGRLEVLDEDDRVALLELRARKDRTEVAATDGQHQAVRLKRLNKRNSSRELQIQYIYIQYFVVGSSRKREEFHFDSKCGRNQAWATGQF
jgi:hypothetical protein